MNEIKNEKNYGFSYTSNKYSIVISKCSDGAFHWAQTSYFWRVVLNCIHPPQGPWVVPRWLDDDLLR